MTEKYQNKYRIQSARLQNWDYGWNASCFVTICTQNREHNFGDIVDGHMELTKIGEIANRYWNQIPDHFPFVLLGEYIVMPNHVHGVVIINKTNNERNVVVETPNLGVSTTTPATKTINGGKNNKWKPGVLGVIINQYKRICTINARKIHADFEWQSRYYDHIIRNNKSFKKIERYIADNPKKWKDDEFYNHRNI